MSLDIDQVLREMAAVIREILACYTHKDENGYIKVILDNEKTSLKELSNARVCGDIGDADFMDEVQREKEVLKTQMLSIELFTAEVAQRAVNAAMDVYVSAVKSALPIE